jgi:hypothetical protein
MVGLISIFAQPPSHPYLLKYLDHQFSLSQSGKFREHFVDYYILAETSIITIA